MYPSVLVPFDGSQASEAAVAFVQRLAAERVRLMRVEPESDLLIMPWVTGVEPDWKDRFAERIREELEPVAGRLRSAGRTVDIEIRFGDPAEEIIAAAADADLVVMSTRGRGAAARLIFGSTADRVARHGTVPTLLLRGGAHPVQPGIPARIIVPLDGSDLAERALPEARKLAHALGTPLHLVRAVDVDEVLLTGRVELARTPQGSRPEESGDAYERARLTAERRAAEYLAAQADGLDVPGVTTGVLDGSPAFALLGVIESNDVVVMTTRGLGGYRRWMIGSVAEKLVREASAPILLVRGPIDTVHSAATGG